MRRRTACLVLLSTLALLGSGCLTVEREHLYSYPRSPDHPLIDHLGEVRNNTDIFFRSVEVTGTYYDAGGSVADSVTGRTCTDLVAPHDTSPFGIVLFNKKWPLIARYELSVLGEPTTDVLPSYLSVEIGGVRFEWGAFPEVYGTVRNNGDVIYDFPRVCVAYYQDGVVAAIYTPLLWDRVRDQELTSLGPGESVGFAAIHDLQPDRPATEVRVWVDGRQQGASGLVMPVSTGIIPVVAP